MNKSEAYSVMFSLLFQVASAGLYVWAVTMLMSAVGNDLGLAIGIMVWWFKPAPVKSA